MRCFKHRGKWAPGWAPPREHACSAPSRGAAAWTHGRHAQTLPAPAAPRPARMLAFPITVLSEVTQQLLITPSMAPHMIPHLLPIMSRRHEVRPENAARATPSQRSRPAPAPRHPLGTGACRPAARQPSFNAQQPAALSPDSTMMRVHAPCSSAITRRARRRPVGRARLRRGSSRARFVLLVEAQPWRARPTRPPPHHARTPATACALACTWATQCAGPCNAGA